MIQALEKFDEKTALGILARTALALEGEGNPDAKAILDGEEAIRSTVLREARKHLNIQQDDERPETIEKLSDFLGDESDRLAGATDTTSALSRLAERGDLPSDLYQVEINQSIANFHGANFGLEKKLIEATIRSPNQEQHFGPEGNSQEPAFISLFARQFKTRFPFKDFTMLVAAHRAGIILKVHQAWRIYPQLVKTENVKNLVDLLHRFADAYGSDVEIGEKRGHFFLLLDRLAPPQIIIQNPGGKPKTIRVYQFMQEDYSTGRQFSSLVMALDLEQYQMTLNKMNLKSSDLLNSL